MSTKFNTTDHQYEGNDPAMAAAQAIANELRKRYSPPLSESTDEFPGYPEYERWLDDITVYSNWQGTPAVGWETGTEWAMQFGYRWLEENGHPGFYFEPYFTFLIQIFEI